MFWSCLKYIFGESPKISPGSEIETQKYLRESNEIFTSTFTSSEKEFFNVELARYDLLDMARVGDIGGIRRLLDDNLIDLNRPNVKGDTAMHIAAMGGYRDVVSFLLDQGANGAIKNEAGFTAAELLEAAETKGRDNNLHSIYVSDDSSNTSPRIDISGESGAMDEVL